MNKIRNKVKQSFAIFLIFMLVFAMFPGAIGAEEDRDYASLVDEAIENTVKHMIETGVTSEWEAIGINRAGYEVPDSYRVYFNNNLDSQVINYGRFAKITDIERIVLASQAIGLNPTNIEGTDIIERIYNSMDNPGGMDTMTLQGNNGPIFGLIALDSGKFTIPEDARWNREKLVNYLLEQQLESGGWALSGTDENIDITSMAIIALSNYTDNPKVQVAIDKAVSFLSQQQGKEGGFDVEFHGGISSESTSQAIIGLTSAGINPTDADFTKDGNNLLDHLLTFEMEEGGFTHVPGESKPNGMATEQALQALVAYKLFITNDSKLYDFGKQDEINPEPEPNPTPDPEVIEVEVGKKVDVSASDIVRIENSKTQIELPEDLPQGTKLTITNPNGKEFPYKESDLELMGDWFNFSFSGTEDYTGTYKLTLGISEKVDLDKVGMYHFNNQHEEWEFIDAEINEEERTITAMVDHFSTYGVFAKVESDPTDDDENPSNQEDSDGNDSKETSDDVDETPIENNDERGGNDNKTTLPQENNKVTEHTSALEGKEGQKLPQTATNSFNMMLAGLMMFILGLIMLGIRKAIRD